MLNTVTLLGTTTLTLRIIPLGAMKYSRSLFNLFYRSVGISGSALLVTTAVSGAKISPYWSSDIGRGYCFLIAYNVFACYNFWRLSQSYMQKKLIQEERKHKNHVKGVINDHGKQMYPTNDNFTKTIRDMEKEETPFPRLYYFILCPAISCLALIGSISMENLVTKVAGFAKRS